MTILVMTNEQPERDKKWEISKLTLYFDFVINLKLRSNVKTSKRGGSIIIENFRNNFLQNYIHS